MTTKDQDCRAWFEQGKQLPSPDKQYNYFSEGFRKGERYQAWAWAGVGLVWLQKGNVESAIDALEKALAINPDIPGIAQQLQMAREKAAARPVPSPDAPATGQATPDDPSARAVTGPEELDEEEGRALNEV